MDTIFGILDEDLLACLCFSLLGVKIILLSNCSCILLPPFTKHAPFLYSIQTKFKERESCDCISNACYYVVKEGCIVEHPKEKMVHVL